MWMDKGKVMRCLREEQRNFEKKQRKKKRMYPLNQESENYNLKQHLNELREENSGLKAKIWNCEKENRRMDKQIESWNINGPELESTTLEKVLHNQDCNIVTMKIELKTLETNLQLQENSLNLSIEQKVEAEEIVKTLSHELFQQQNKLTQGLEILVEKEQEIKNKLNKINEKMKQVTTNIEARKRQKIILRHKLNMVKEEGVAFEKISEFELNRLNKEIHEMRNEHINEGNAEKNTIKGIEQEIHNVELAMQEKMNEFIRIKISLNKKIEEIYETI